MTFRNQRAQLHYDEGVALFIDMDFKNEEFMVRQWAKDMKCIKSSDKNGMTQYIFKRRND